MGIVNGKGHFRTYNIFMILLSLFIGIYYGLIKWAEITLFEPMLIEPIHLLSFYVAFFLINPDIDLLFGVSEHRSIITHSVLYPIGIYWCFHPFLNMETAKVFGLIIFTPVLIHLIADYRINDMIKEDEGKGSWRISWNFFSIKIKRKERSSLRIGIKHKRMNKTWSILWVIGNIISIIGYIIWIWITL